MPKATGKESSRKAVASKTRNGTAAKKNSKHSTQPVPQAPDANAISLEPPPHSEFDEFVAKRREKQSAALQQVAATAASAPPISDQQPDQLPAVKDPQVAPTQVTTQYLHRAGASSFFYAAAAKLFGDQISAQVVQDYIDQLVVCCDAHHDPLEVFLVERIALLRFTGAFLQGMSVNAEGPQNQALFSSTANQTSAEMRRVITTLRDYRKDNGLGRSKPADTTENSESSTAETPK